MTPNDKQTMRDTLWGLLGDLPARDRAISGKQVAREERESYWLERWLLELNGAEAVPAVLTVPKAGKKPYPAVLYNHAHGNEYHIGKKEFTEARDAIQNPPYAEALAREGILGLCIDHWAFGGRQGRRETEIFKEMLWTGRVMWGWMVYDSVRALDWLCERDDVDKTWLGTLGLSMGATMAWWLAALDERIQVCVDICCMTDFHTLIQTRGLDGHGWYYYVPGLLKAFTTASINELIVPRAHLSLNGTYDPLTPPAGLAKIDKALKGAYADAGKPENWRMCKYPHGHFETSVIRTEVLEFLRSQKFNNMAPDGAM